MPYLDDDGEPTYLDDDGNPLPKKQKTPQTVVPGAPPPPSGTQVGQNAQPVANVRTTGPLSRFFGGLNRTTVAPTAGAIGGVAGYYADHPIEGTLGMLYGLPQMRLAKNLFQGSQAASQEEWSKALELGTSRPAEGGLSGVGHGIAASVPLVGPAVAPEIDRMFQGDVAGGVGGIAGMVGQMILGNKIMSRMKGGASGVPPPVAEVPPAAPPPVRPAPVVAPPVAAAPAPVVASTPVVRAAPRPTPPQAVEPPPVPVEAPPPAALPRPTAPAAVQPPVPAVSHPVEPLVSDLGNRLKELRPTAAHVKGFTSLSEEAFGKAAGKPGQGTAHLDFDQILKESEARADIGKLTGPQRDAAINHDAATRVVDATLHEAAHGPGLGHGPDFLARMKDLREALGRGGYEAEVKKVRSAIAQHRTTQPVEPTPAPALPEAPTPASVPHPNHAVVPPDSVWWRGAKGDGTLMPNGSKFYTDDPEVARAYAKQHGKGAKVTDFSPKDLKNTIHLDLDTDEGMKALDEALAEKGTSFEKIGDINLAVEEATDVWIKKGHDSALIDNMPSPDESLQSAQELVVFPKPGSAVTKAPTVDIKEAYEGVVLNRIKASNGDVDKARARSGLTPEEFDTALAGLRTKGKLPTESVSDGPKARPAPPPLPPEQQAIHRTANANIAKRKLAEELAKPKPDPAVVEELNSQVEFYGGRSAAGGAGGGAGVPPRVPPASGASAPRVPPTPPATPPTTPAGGGSKSPDLPPVRMTLGERTGSGAIKKVEGAVEGTFGGIGPFKKFREAQQADIQNMAKAVSKGISEFEGTDEAVGIRFQKDAETALAGLKSSLNTEYGELDAMVGSRGKSGKFQKALQPSTLLPKSFAKEALKQIKAESGLVASSISKELVEILEKVADAPDRMTFKAMQGARSTLAGVVRKKGIGSLSDKGGGIVKKLVNTIDTAMEEAASKNPEVLKKWRELNARSKDLHDVFDRSAVASMMDAAPEKVPGMIKGMSLEDIDRLHMVSPKETVGALQRRVVESIFDDATVGEAERHFLPEGVRELMGRKSSPDVKMKPDKLRKTLEDRYGIPKLERIFKDNPQGLKNVFKVLETAERVGHTKGSIIGAIANFRVLQKAGKAALTMDPTELLEPAAIMASAKILSKLSTSTWGSNTMVEWLKASPGTAKYQFWAARMKEAVDKAEKGEKDKKPSTPRSSTTRPLSSPPSRPSSPSRLPSGPQG